MADALCGPSNALQNFQKHSQADRTLQHDRLVSRQSPTQGFRSSPGPNVGLLDPEFEAFQAGHIASPPPQFDTTSFLAQNNSRFAPQRPQSALPDWANDFQRMHISSGPAHQNFAPAVQRAPQATSQAPRTTSWHQDFLQSQQQPLSNIHHAQPMFQQFPDMSWEYDQAAQFSPVAQGKQRVAEQQDAQWNAEAFAAAFEAATQDAQFEESGLTEEMLAREIAREIEMETEEIQFLIQRNAEEIESRQGRQESNHLTALDLSQGFLDVDEEFASAEQAHPHPEALFDDNHLGIHEPVHDLPREAEAETRASATPPAVDEELARTAGHLLESVSHDTSQKFQESVFLQLMRRLRDKEVTVEGENFVEVSEDPLQSLPIPPPDEGVN